jgi:hypothetical protein
LLRQSTRPCSVPSGKGHDRIGCDLHCAQLFAPGIGLRVVQPVERLDRRLDLALEVAHPPMVDLVVEHRVARRALLHELGIDPRLVGGDPILSHIGKDALAHRPATPKRDDLLGIDLPRPRRHGKRDLCPGVQDLQVAHRVAAQLGVGRRRLGRSTLFAHDQLAVADIDRLVCQQVAEGQCALHRW